MQNTLFLYGPPASGKTTLGRRLAAALGWTFADLDAEIVRAAGRPVRDIFAADGEPAFRRLESDALRRIVDAATAPLVLALGGGTLLDPANRAFAESRGPVWCLEAPPPAERARRFAANPSLRPLGDKAAERAPHYASFPSRVAASFDLPGSLVLVGQSLGRPDDFAPLAVADATAAEAQRLAGPAIVSLPFGEARKTLATVASLWSLFAARGLGRRDRVASFGGGVAGDLVGFVAATWMRGIDWIACPTTLLAMVDASTGGKTACDLPEGKNLVGAFHPPALVLADADRLATLPPREIRNGRAEMIKHAVIAGLPLPSAPADALPTPAEIAENLAVKVAAVREDPFERTGRRLLLNCGHTVAHALEIASNFAYSHGEAVAVGCVEEARLAVRLGLADPAWPAALADAFAAAGLPVALPPEHPFPSLVPLMRGDKKRAGSTVTFALPCAPGDVRPTPLDLSAPLP